MLVWEEALAISQLCRDADASPTHKRRRGEGITCLQGRDVLTDAVRSQGQEFTEIRGHEAFSASISSPT